MSNSDNPPPQPTTPRPIASLNRLRLAMDHDLRIRLGLVITMGGFIAFIIGCEPNFIGMDRSPLVGVVQIVIFLTGLLVVCLGGFICVIALWKGQPLSIPADIGLRLVGTGYVVSFFSGFADVFGLGSHKPPNTPFFGPWQARGVMGGEVIIIIGFLMLMPLFYRVSPPISPPDPEDQDKSITLNIS